MRPLIVTGCGRSGTGYAAALLTNAGVECGHEDVFTGRLDTRPVLTEGADSSWFALPYLAAQDAYVVHQVRHPLQVVASWLANRSLESRFVRRFLSRWCPQALAESTPARGVLRYWVDWNQRAASKCAQQWVVDQITPDALGHALAESGRPTRHAKAAVDQTPREVNTKATVTPISWSAFGETSLVDQAQVLADEYGIAP